jgi:RNA polymerase sigma factor (sigma-70 family)
MTPSRPISSAAAQVQPAAQPANWLEAEPDHHLVELMALKGEDEKIAMRACEELYGRHAGFLLEWCSTKGWVIFGEAAEDFVNDTFIRAYDGAGSFKGNDKWSAEVSGKKVRLWLMRILRNANIDRYRSQADERRARRRAETEFLPAEVRTDEHIIDLSSQPPTSADELPVNPELVRVAEQVLEELTPFEQRVAQTLIEFFNPITQEVEMPAEVRKGICMEFKISESSLNVYRKRARDRLRKKAAELK